LSRNLKDRSTWRALIPSLPANACVQLLISAEIRKN
jgi:hypothetical protein